MNKELAEIRLDLEIAGDNYIEILKKYGLNDHAQLIETIKKSI